MPATGALPGTCLPNVADNLVPTFLPASWSYFGLLQCAAPRFSLVWAYGARLFPYQDRESLVGGLSSRDMCNLFGGTPQKDYITSVYKLLYPKGGLLLLNVGVYSIPK